MIRLPPLEKVLKWLPAAKVASLFGSGLFAGYYLFSSSSSSNVDIPGEITIPAIHSEKTVTDQHLYGFSKLYTMVSQAKGERAFTAAARHLVEKAPEIHRSSLLHLLMGKWADENLESALGYASRSLPSETRLEVLESTLKNAGTDGISSALKWVGHHGGNPQEQERLFAATFSGLVSTDPQSAAGAAAELPDGALRDRVMRSVVDSWAQVNAEPVFDWIESQPVSGQLDELYAATMVHYIDQQPENAGYMITAMGSGNLKSALAGQYADKLAQKDPQSALHWGEALEDAGAKLQAIGVAFDHWAQRDGESALTYALNFEEGALRNTLLGQAATHLARTDPLGMATSLDQFPDQVRPAVAEQLAVQWAGQNSSETTLWIRKLDGGPVRDKAVQGAVYQLRKRDPVRAFDLATMISDPGLRYGMLRDAAGHWHEINPDAAREAVAGDPVLTESQKFVILSDVFENRPPIDLVLPGTDQ